MKSTVYSPCMARIASRSRSGSGGRGSDATAAPQDSSGSSASLKSSSDFIDGVLVGWIVEGSKLHRQADREAAAGRGEAVQHAAGGNGQRQVSGRPVPAVGEVAHPGMQPQAWREVPVRVQVEHPVARDRK